MKRVYKRIKDIIHMSGLSDNGLRLYEKAGIIHPVYNEENGYREISMGDGQLLAAGLTLRKCGFSIRETADIFNTMDIAQQTEQIAQRNQRMSDELTLQFHAIRQIDERVSLMRQYQIDPLCCQCIPATPLYFLPIHTDHMVSLSGLEDCSQWVSLKPFATTTILLPQDHLPLDDRQYNIGLSMWCHEMQWVHAPLNHAIRLGGEGLQYVQAFTCSDTEDPLTLSTYAHALQYIDAQGLTLRGDAFTRNLTYERGEMGWKRIDALYIPVQAAP